MGNVSTIHVPEPNARYVQQQQLSLTTTMGTKWLICIDATPFGITFSCLCIILVLLLFQRLQIQGMYSTPSSHMLLAKISLFPILDLDCLLEIFYAHH